MADFLTHIFLPLTAAVVLWPERFRSPLFLGMAGFGLLADLDKFLGQPGLLHSLVTLVPMALVVVIIERIWNDYLQLSPLIVFFIFSHLVLDFLDGGPVPLLFPLWAEGIGLQYPARTVFGSGPFGVSIDGPLVALRLSTPRSGFNSYGFISGFGVTSLLLFVLVYVHKFENVARLRR